jgi:hypothetical protein
MKTAFALLLIVHGIAHLVGFVVPWRLFPSPDLAVRTTVFGGALDVGEAGAKVLGIVWLGLAASFIASGAGLMSGWWNSLWTVRLAALSLVFCIVGWPDTRIGLVVNVAILAVLFRFGSLRV